MQQTNECKLKLSPGELQAIINHNIYWDGLFNDQFQSTDYLKDEDKWFKLRLNYFNYRTASKKVTKQWFKQMIDWDNKKRYSVSLNYGETYILHKLLDIVPMDALDHYDLAVITEIQSKLYSYLC